MYPIVASPRRIKLQPDYSTLYVDKGSIKINESAASILCLCTGENSVQDIIRQLVVKYDEREEKVSSFVKEFLDYSVRVKTINWSANPELINLALLGSTDYWTPDAVVIELTHDCPLSCKHCFLDAGHGASMEKKVIERLCEEVVAIGVDMVQLTGGEPLVYPGIEDIISFFCSQSTIRLTITTSGMVSSPRIYRAMASMRESGGWVQVSLDGFESIHNRLRGNQHSYSRAVKFIKSLVSIGVDVHVATCVTSESVDELEALCEQVKDWGARFHRIGVVSERGRAIESGIGSPVELRQRVVGKRRKLKTRYDSPNFTVAGFEDDLPVEWRDNKNCGAGYRTLKISPDGKIHPCPMMDWPIGTIEHSSLLDFIQRNSSRFANVYSPSEEYCGACLNLTLCDGCMAEALLYRETVGKCNWSESQAIDTILGTWAPVPLDGNVRLLPEKRG